MARRNISQLQQLKAFGGQAFPSLPGMLKPRLREVSTIPSWIYCFLAYIAIRSSDPYTRDMLAYARLVIRKVQRHGGNAWLTYDKVFRQQAALDHSLQWNTGIQAATLVGQPSGTGMFCTLCREPDHTADHCALTYLQHPYSQPPRGQHLYGQPTAARGAPMGQRPQVPQDRHPAAAHGICIAWNKGACKFPGNCTYRHMCATCHQRHKACDCPRTPDDSEYKKDTRPQARGQPFIPMRKS